MRNRLLGRWKAAFRSVAALSAQAGTLDRSNRGQLIFGCQSRPRRFGLRDIRACSSASTSNECKAIAAASQRPTVKFLPINARTDPPSCRRRDRRLNPQRTWTLSAPTGGVLHGIHVYDGAWFMVRKKLGVDSAL